MKVQKVQEVLCSGFLDVLRLSSLRSRYLSVYEKVKLLIMKKCANLVYNNGRLLDLCCIPVDQVYSVHDFTPTTHPDTHCD